MLKDGIPFNVTPIKCKKKIIILGIHKKTNMLEA